MGHCSIRLRLFCTCMVIFMLPLCLIGILGGGWAMTTVMENTEESYRAVMANTMRRFCEDIDNLSNVVTLFNEDTRIQKITYMQGDQINYARANVMELHNFSRELIFHCTNNQLYSNVAICFPTKNAVISTLGLWNLDWFLEDEFHIASMEYQDWLDLFNQRGVNHLIPNADKTSFGSKTDGLAYVYTAERNANGDALMSVIFWIDAQRLDDYIRDLMLFPGTVAVLSDLDGQYIHAYSPLVDDDVARSYWESMDESDRFTSEDGEQYRVMRYASDASDWHFTVWLPEQEIYAEANQLLQAISILAIVILLIGVALSFELALINYRPLERIFSALGTLVTGITGGNTASHQVARTEQQLHQMIRQCAQWHDQTASNRQILQRAGLTHMLHGDPEFESVAGEGVLAMLNMPMPYRFFSVCVLLQGGDAEAERLCSAWEDKGSKAYAVHQGRPAAIIVNHNSEDLAAEIAQMPWAAEFCFSAAKRSISELPMALQEAMAARMHRPVQACGPVFYDKLEISEHIKVLTAQQERHLLGVLADGSEARATAMLNQMIERGPQPMTRYLASKWVSAVEDMLFRTAETQDQLKERLSAIAPPKDDAPEHQLDYARSMVAEAAKLQNELLNRQKSTIREALIEYIDAHLCDPQLNLSSVAEAMNITPAHLSRTFKEQMGVGYLEYVNEKRVMRAKALIVEQNMSVGEAAQRTGFTSDATFRRLFKKYTGFAPSKMDRGSAQDDAPC